MEFSNIDKVKSYKLKNNHTLEGFLEEKHKGYENGWTVEGENVVFFYSPTKKLADNPLKSPAKYKWTVKGDKIIALNGRALELTPELSEVRESYK